MSNITRVAGVLGFSEPASFRPRFHANDVSLDQLNLVRREVSIEDARQWPTPPTLDVEGFSLVQHHTAVVDFRDEVEVQRVHFDEIRTLLLQLTGADEVAISGRAILRFGERSNTSGALDNSRPARMVHIDVSDKTAAEFRARAAANDPRPVLRSAQYNIWRVLTPPPQDVPLAVCDARSLAAEDLIPADAMFDVNGQIVMSFEALLVRHNPAQRWAYFSGMSREEALVFKTHDSDLAKAHHVPHGAFDDPTCPADAVPRGSVEMRGAAYWYA